MTRSAIVACLAITAALGAPRRAAAGAATFEDHLVSLERRIETRSLPYRTQARASQMHAFLRAWRAETDSLLERHFPSDPVRVRALFDLAPEGPHPLWGIGQDPARSKAGAVPPATDWFLTVNLRIRLDRVTRCLEGLRVRSLPVGNLIARLESLRTWHQTTRLAPEASHRAAMAGARDALLAMGEALDACLAALAETYGVGDSWGRRAAQTGDRPDPHPSGGAPSAVPLLGQYMR